MSSFTWAELDEIWDILAGSQYAARNDEAVAVWRGGQEVLVYPCQETRQWCSTVEGEGTPDQVVYDGDMETFVWFHGDVKVFKMRGVPSLAKARDLIAKQLGFEEE